MRHYHAIQRELDGKFIYVCGGMPLGYCRNYEETLSAHQKYDPASVPLIESLKHKFHESGHATEQEAYDCYKQYIIDIRRRDSKQTNQQHRCQECKEFTQNLVYFGPYYFLILCDDHKDNEEIIKKHMYVGETWES